MQTYGDVYVASILWYSEDSSVANWYTLSLHSHCQVALIESGGITLSSFPFVNQHIVRKLTCLYRANQPSSTVSYDGTPQHDEIVLPQPRGFFFLSRILDSKRNILS